MSAAYMYNCSMCPYYGKTKEEILQHLVRRHKNEPKFKVHCSKPGCGSSFNKIRSFSQHLYRKHSSDVFSEIESDEEETTEEMSITHEDVDNEELTPEQNKKRSEAQFLLKMIADHNLSQRAIEDIITSTKLMLNDQSNVIKSELSKKIPENIFNQLDFNQIIRDTSFSGLETQHLREKYFQEELGYIKPVPVKLGSEFIQKRLKQKYRFVEKEHYGYFIPVFQQLVELLKMPEIKEELHKETENSFEINDFYDGSYYQKQYFQNHRNALLFCIYYDDFEIVNPIGSHKKKHKLSIFYWTLLNITPEFRYKSAATQLLAIAKATHLKKYGMKALFEDFIHSMQELHKGKVLTINGENLTIYGTLYCVIGDTPAAQYLGGFKEGVGNAEKPCRVCEVSLENIDYSFSDRVSKLRNEEEHRDRCEILKELKGKTLQYWSKKYGISRQSELLDIPEFEVTKCILQDPMHVLLEGIVKLELQLLLTSFIEKKKYFSLRDLNGMIKNFSYTVEEGADKPQVLEKKALDIKKNFPMSAVETKNFMTLLPFMIGSEIDEHDENWKNFIRLLKITLLVISPVASSNTIMSLRQLIYSHNYSFRKLYPEILFTPKLHYLIHFPDQILKFGPARNHWCMRMEAKHGLFKNKKWKNFKDLPLSVALHHQRWMCLQQCGSNGKTEVYLYTGDSVSYGVEKHVQELSDTVRNTLRIHNPEFEAQQVLQSNQIEIKGITYRPGSVLIEDYAEGDIAFIFIKHMFIFNNKKYLECSRLEILYYDRGVNAFACKVVSENETLCICTQDLKYKWPQIMHSINGTMFIMLANVDFCWD
ncbi:uncharacterized protein LOC134240278 isoform X1 [Saccostrea cucullata]|uniref:uncharacterized protein LOC134240278 isoform X1 n=1 Tax=Saccostrea cuccullata TaxID=36930 RepID=UPI002ED02FA0